MAWWDLARAQAAAPDPALGWTVLRFTWSDLVDRPGYAVAMIRGLAA